ncbi:MAG: pentapeptide repeat-containing protein [Acidobacteria bacterium]|nr:pentapeptide repeat-containing protein [Acidobacteriota bacterium]
MENKKKTKTTTKTIVSQPDPDPVVDTKPAVSEPSKIQNPASQEIITTDTFWKYYPRFIKLVIGGVLFLPIVILTGLQLSKIFGIYLVGLLAMIFSFLAIWYFPKENLKYLRNKLTSETQSEFEKERDILKITDDTRKTVAQIIGGAFFIFGLIVTYDTYQLTKQRIFSERYSEAIKLVKDDDSLARMAGLFEIRNISKEPNSSSPVIKDILILYINTHSQKILDSNKQKNADGCQCYSTEKLKDIESAAQILGDKNTYYSYLGDRIELNNVFFFNANLEGVNFEKAVFRGGCFTETNLNNAYLSGSNFIDADLTGANFINADLRGANLVRTNITVKQIKQAYVSENTQVPPNPELQAAKKERIAELNKKSNSGTK